MRKVVLSLIAATALAGATAANAGITISSSTGSCGTVLTCTNTSDGASANFDGYNPASGSFSYTVNFMNDLAGDYLVSLTTSNAHQWYDFLTITGTDGSITYSGSPTHAITLLPGSLGVGSYVLTFGGTGPKNASINGSLSFTAVPEPATWALMLLGFGGIGMAMRRRRSPALAQVA